VRAFGHKRVAVKTCRMSSLRDIKYIYQMMTHEIDRICTTHRSQGKDLNILVGKHEEKRETEN
jgi:hypothetical protein